MAISPNYSGGSGGGTVDLITSSGDTIDVTNGAGPTVNLEVASPGGLVSSVFGRTGDVAAEAGDYTAAEVGALVSTSTLNSIAAAHAASASVPMNNQKLTGLAAGTGAGDSVRFEQLPVVPVTSVFGRTGTVTATSGDYTDAQITGSPTNVLTTTGDVLYASGANTLARLGIGAAGSALYVVSGLPAWKMPAAAQSAPTGQTTASTSGVMLGAAAAITPVATGRILIIVVGENSNTGGFGNTSTIGARFGTGTAPVPGAAATGTTPTGFTDLVLQVQGQVPFTVCAIVTGLTLGTAYWVDLAWHVNGSTGAILTPNFTVIEF